MIGLQFLLQDRVPADLETMHALGAPLLLAGIPTVLHPDFLLVIGLIFFLLLIVLVLWIGFRRRLAEIQSDQEQQREHLEVLENKMARIEGALFYGPSATWTLEHRKQTQDRGPTLPSDPQITKDL